MAIKGPFKLLELMQRAFGKRFVNQIIGTKANVVKPQRFDVNAPTKSLYNPKAFENDKTYDLIETQLMEYAPFQLSNKNAQEVANYQANLEMYLNARNKKAGGSTEFVQAKEETPGEIIDLKTKSKVDDEGILSLKEKFGLPEGVDPQSPRGKFIQALQRAETGSPEAEKLAGEGLENFLGFGREVQGPDLLTEARRRAVVRQILLNDNRIDLPPAIRKSLKNRDDLAGGADQNLDPLNIYDTYYERNNTKFDALDGIIEGSRNEKEAVDEFVKEFDGFDLKPKVSKEKPVVRESIDDELRELEDQEILDEDIDPDELATGGRVGYAAGSGLKLAKFLKSKGKNLMTEIKRAVDDIIPSGDSKYDADVAIDNMLDDLGVDRDMFDEKDMMNLYGIAYNSLVEKSVPQGLASMITKKGKGEIKMADEVTVPDEVRLEKEMRDLQNNPMDFVKTVTPKFYERMELKIRYPGITDDLIEKIMIDDNPQRKAEILATLDEAFKMTEKGMDADAILNAIKNTPRTKQADGGLSYLMGV